MRRRATSRPPERTGLFMARILIVEDTDQLAQLIHREVSAAGYDVILAGTGNEALVLHEREQPDLIVLDWMLPGLDGIEVLRRIRETSPTPVLMLTARSEEIDRVMGLEIGADDYLTKPFSMRELLARIRALLRREEMLRKVLASDRSQSTIEIRYGVLKLDPDARTVQHGDEELVSLMMRNPGRTFSRSYLLQTVWDVEFGGDRSVDNTVMRLRRKLGDAGEAIETVWGVGYRLRRQAP